MFDGYDWQGRKLEVREERAARAPVKDDEAASGRSNIAVPATPSTQIFVRNVSTGTGDERHD